MSENVKLAVTLEPDAKAAIEKYAAFKGCSMGEALDLIIASWAGRRNAVRKWAANNAPEPKAKKAAKAKPAKKAAKAKGPLARKTKAAKEEAAA